VSYRAVRSQERAHRFSIRTKLAGLGLRSPGSRLLAAGEGRQAMLLDGPGKLMRWGVPDGPGMMGEGPPQPASSSMMTWSSPRRGSPHSTSGIGVRAGSRRRTLFVSSFLVFVLFVLAVVLRPPFVGGRHHRIDASISRRKTLFVSSFLVFVLFVLAVVLRPPFVDGCLLG
jgi:hypothetical protein